MSRFVVFFDIGETLGVPTGFDARFRLAGLRLYPFVTAILHRLSTRQVRIGIISNTSDDETTENMRRVLEEADIYSFFEAGLLLYSGVEGLRKDSPRVFERAAEKAGLADDPERCIFVGENLEEGAFAQEAGFRYVPHPLLLEEALDGQPLLFVKIQVPAGDEAREWAPTLSSLPLVPLRVTGANRAITYAVTSPRVAGRLDDLGFAVTRLGAAGRPERDRLYLLRDDRSRQTGFLAEAGQSVTFAKEPRRVDWVLESSPDGLLVALPAGESIDDHHFEYAGHGHTVRLSPDPSLLRPFGNAPNAVAAAWTTAAAPQGELCDADRAALAEIGADEIAALLSRYAGIGSPSLDDRITSRHVAHPDNLIAVKRAVEDFEAIGSAALSVRRHPFTLGGKSLFNVEAELPGNGPELVLVTAHLDSTAAFSDDGYDPLLDPAPGADDDGSGVAVVIAVARALVRVAAEAPLARTVRFVLFNAEEQGLVGSQAYARDAAAFDAPIVAVYQMDMVGYREKQDEEGGSVERRQPFEVHLGFPTDPDVEARSFRLAEIIGAATEAVSQSLRPPQIYRANDPAAGRSDHASFQERGYAACVMSEDFFIGPRPDSPEPQQNPNYHKPGDVIIDFKYTADIARVVGGAALLTARG